MTDQVAPYPPVIAPSDALFFLTQAGETLASSLDYDETLQSVVQLTVPQFADWCAVYVQDDDGTEHELTSVHPDPQVEQMILEVRRRRRESGTESESLQVLQTGQAVLATDVRETRVADLSEGEAETMARLAPRSYMLVPLTARGRVLGALTFLSTTEGRHYTESDLQFAQALGMRCATAIDNARLFGAAERSLAQLDALFTTVPVGIAFLDAQMRYLRINDALAAINGRPVEAHLGQTVEQVLGEPARPVIEILRRVIDTREPLIEEEHSLELPDGERHFITSFTPVLGLEGHLLGVGVTVIDVTERRRLLVEEREARLRADFLAQAGAMLDSSLDYEETLANVTQIAVPEVADWCGISILDDAGVLREVAAAHPDPAKREVGRELRERYPPDPDGTTGAVGVIRSGQVEFVPEVTDEMLVAAIHDPDQLRLVRALGLESVIIAPLRARDRSLGTLTLANAESGRVFDQDDVQLAVELARRAGVAIENARLYTERSRIAHTLQARLLPERLPEIDGLEIAARYRAAGELNEVGGDFYDVFERADGTWALVVGDVSGKGAEAAAVTALGRYTLRAVARDGSPAAGLTRLNEAMLSDGTAQFATVALVAVRPSENGSTAVDLALGGHLPPLVMRADGRVEAVGRYGELLGAYADPRLTDCEIALEPGDVMLLYTDGVTEAGPRDDPVGQEGLEQLLASLNGKSPDQIVDAVERFAASAQDGDPQDDIALVAVRVRERDA
jgi:PAS domain S-box-containing protein